MFEKISRYFSCDVGIDLGTANTLVYVATKGIVINEPSVVAINNKTKQVLAIGAEAQKMVGKTPGYIVASRPLVDGVISDFEVTEAMLKYFINHVQTKKIPFFSRPRVVVGIPFDVTEVERRAVEEATLNAGARQVFLIEEPIAAAIGGRLPIQEPGGSFIVDIGGGTTEVAVISMGGIVVSKSLRVAGDELTQGIIDYTREKNNLLIGEKTAEEIKIKIGSALPYKDDMKMTVRGRNLLSGLPFETVITNGEVYQAMKKPINQIVEAIKNALEEAPPELAADIYEKGIFLAGGGALLKGMDKLINSVTKTKVNIVDDPLTAVARGTGFVLEDLDNLIDVLLPTEFGK
ncbi:rod shape-determining protein [Candidatus Berkelbacteria bacterium CG_4_10_14_0_8_um_filter_35_9_33_8]|uniref:Cell shape-determining protein MreB n=1 Tax=Candidatus Berkelbacteria bacterium CG_4_10_14_0_2_um_filter_35_9_33_12 TaxID=1974499 RepID=A0A2M7W4B6_9BACT|nr:MAG: rod shape-determining protein [Candidatus Berkelbacteria bacterium CG23_combo_of_CG06-09_8_20_14_all_33_15]PIS08197.1 MAG: rod shape-determining protein [Candidatus Berkelbacteria bacterium CG10_big_fil_rev_8_21_14_0_10_33_10]PIZ28156.1 MAG: rod shape-determining protein [Candidatus Berkelbacteria bacterium CG_4_10_14_0_8_um_filter_35_9_33_8]PJA20589.1 MAG: rod shape-determining protein [Candidatus Berkelbacteria bacterium CG_4_10_14_0_2_um_filter_35_9_33_12]